MSEGRLSPRELGRASARGGLSTLSGQGMQLVIQLTSLTVLARLLDPRDYGLVAIVMVMVGVGEVFRDAGLSSAAIQAKTLSDTERSNLWWCAAGIGAVLTTVMALLSPVLAWFFGEPQLTALLLTMSASFLLAGMASQHRASLQRELRFGALSLVNVSTGLIALMVAICAALAGWGPWALIVQNLTGALLAAIATAILSGWRPHRYDRSVSVSHFFRFGMPLLGTQVAQYLAGNSDTALIGALHGPGVVGLYNRAIQVVRMPLNQIRTPVGQVAFAALSRQQSDSRMLARFAERGQLLLGYPITLLAGGISAAAAPLVALVLGPGWEGGVPYLHLIAVGEGLNTLAMTGGWLYMVRERTASLMKYTVFSAVVRLSLLTIGMLSLGPLGAAVAVAVAPFILWPVSLIWSGRVTGVPTWSMLVTSYRIFAVALLASGTTALVVVLTQPWGDAAAVLLGVLTQLAVAALAAVLPAVRRDYRLVQEAVLLARG